MLVLWVELVSFGGLFCLVWWYCLVCVADMGVGFCGGVGWRVVDGLWWCALGWLSGGEVVLFVC